MEQVTVVALAPNDIVEAASIDSRPGCAAYSRH